MKQDKQQLTTGKRILRIVGYLVLSAIIGGVIGAAVASGVLQSDIFKSFSLEHVLWVTRTFMLLSLLLFAYFTYQARRHYQLLQEVDEEKEEELERLDKLCLRNLEYSSLFYNASVIFMIFNLFLSLNFVFSDTESVFSISMIDFGILLICFPLQILMMKTIQKIRNYKLSAFPTVKEMKGFLDSMDEGAKQANYEINYEVVFRLNQVILPGLYLLIVLMEALTQTKQVLALAIVFFIHLYINFAQIKMIRRYFK